MKPYQEQTYYELLEVPPSASPSEIRAAYERAVETYSAESVALYALENPAQADELREKLREAMEILSDHNLRRQYDLMIGVPPGEHAEDSPPAPALASAELVAAPEALHSTHPEVRVAYHTPMPPPVSLPVLAAPPAEAPAPVAPAPVPAPAPVVVYSVHDAPTPMMHPPVHPAAPPAAPAPAHEPPPLPARAVRGATREIDAAPVIAEQEAIASAEAAMAQAAARARETAIARPKPLELPPDAEFSGELLRRIRESRGLTVQQIADRTRISTRHLENIEADRYAALPTTVYLRGILSNLARELGLDQARVSKSYLQLVASGKKP